MGGSSAEWNAQIAHFESSHLAIAVDLNGSIGEAAGGSCVVVGLGGAVAGLIRERRLRNVVLVAHSLGRRIAIEAASQAAAQVLALVSIDGSQSRPAPKAPRVVSRRRAVSRASSIPRSQGCSLPATTLR
jgi:pimeloyl-ACP methyl ester carboxylesterase